MNRITLDHLDGISFDGDAPPIANLSALGFMPAGIHWAAETIRRAENDFVRSFPIAIESQDILLFMGSSGPTGDGVVISATHWFAISITNYARLVALIGLMDSKSWKSSDIADPSNRSTVQKFCKQYVDGLLPEVLTWRNKVAAHFAATDPRDDNLATLEQSLMNPLTYERDRIKTSSLTLHSGGHVSAIPSWCATETFERLAPRWWPNLKLSARVTRSEAQP